ncbi:Pre-C2HC domain,Zinc finger, CCHC-type [Cinara cedri]|uniref:Pre-C2HC domain,Zinc finger, CCHC-type n=1 Tax=Cinara cedri TaxID=506608 RepID=A0A5E4N4J0_9HEMI|nr:Pre-C2HC domain,Zinc finger, CCHC-type [Cinara cedri]
MPTTSTGPTLTFPQESNLDGNINVGVKSTLPPLIFLKEDKPIRVVIRNLHPSTSTELIKTELELGLFEVRQVTSVLHKIDKHPLPLFFVDLEPTIQSYDIYKLKSLIHTKIKVEEPYKLKTISQCINCQDYGHTKSYCGYPARCVRCGALHSSSACPNPRDPTPKCALCPGDHPSNYKGCSVYKELQLRNKPKMSGPLLGNLTHKKNVQVSQPVVTPLAYSSDSSQTYAQATSGTHPNNIIPPPVSDINKFLNKFKLLINPLIALLTQFISKLLEKKQCLLSQATPFLSFYSTQTVSKIIQTNSN